LDKAVESGRLILQYKAGSGKHRLEGCEVNSSSHVALKTSAYAALSLVIVLAYAFADGTEFSLWVAVCAAVASALVVQRSTRGESAPRLIPFFFWAAAGHSVFGYWAAGNSTDAIWIGSNAEQMFRRALFVIAATLLVAAFTYDVAPRFPSAWALHVGRHLRVSEQRLVLVARCFVLLGVFCVAFLIATVGFIPILAADPGAARYIFTELGSKYYWYDWVRIRGLELLTFSVPLVLFSGVIYRRKLDVLIGGLGVLGILVTVQRGPLISVFVVLMLTISLVKGRFPRKYFAYIGILVAAYFGSQLIYLNALSEGADSGAATTAVLSALPEVRDLGWVISVAGEKRFYGATFVPPMLPVPGIATDFKIQYGLGYVTERLMGLQEGLRITLPGEGYLNFGPVGFLVIGVGFGILCASLSDLSGVILKNRDFPSSYLTAVLFAWLCFWLYLGGTANAVTVEYELVFLFAMFFLAGAGRGKLNAATDEVRIPR
jgi:hypothetical protein